MQFITDNGYKGLLVVSRESFHLRSAFFDHFYSSGLKNKIWYFSACEMGRLSDMTSSMQRILKNGHFLYWTNSVATGDASKAAGIFYGNLVAKGLDAAKAYEQIPKINKEDLQSEVTVIREGVKIKYKSTTNLKMINTGVLKHGIELVEMIHPEKNRTLQPGDFYPVEGDFGDGQKETISLKVRLYGYTMAEFEKKQMRFSLKVDDKTILNKIKFLPASENNITVNSLPGTKLGVELEIENIKIPDLGGKSEITLKAYLHFDNKYFSIHSAKVNVRATGILAIVDDGKQLAKFYFDSARDAVRVETEDSPTDSYMDSEGYFYFYNTNDGLPLGWIKSKEMAFMFTGNFSFTSKAGDKHVNDKTGKFNFPIIAWAQKHKMLDYEQNPNFKKQRIDSLDDKKYIKFLGVSGQEKDHYAIFNSNGKLIKMGQNNVNIEFTYGEYEVKLPNAEEVLFGFPPIN